MLRRKLRGVGMLAISIPLLGFLSTALTALSGLTGCSGYAGACEVATAEWLFHSFFFSLFGLVFALILFVRYRRFRSMLETFELETAHAIFTLESYLRALK
jgi:hypothetical protein